MKKHLNTKKVNINSREDYIHTLYLQANNNLISLEKQIEARKALAFLKRHSKGVKYGKK